MKLSGRQAMLKPFPSSRWRLPLTPAERSRACGKDNTKVTLALKVGGRIKRTRGTYLFPLEEVGVPALLSLPLMIDLRSIASTHPELSCSLRSRVAVRRRRREGLPRFELLAIQKEPPLS